MSGFAFGRWTHPSWAKWCGRCGAELPRHTHLTLVSDGLDAEARLQVIYTGLEAAAW